MRRSHQISLALGLLLSSAYSQLALAASCPDLLNVRIDNTVITDATAVTAGELALGNAVLNVPSMCRVEGIIAPAIHFEVWLPLNSNWNGRLQMVGGGGLAGIISYPAMATAVNAGYVTSSTDTGHVASDNNWLVDRGRIEDYGHRAIHETAVKSKQILAALYGRPQDFAYFNGCSTGGRQGLMEAQRYPDDFDGIVSGAPVFNFTNLHMSQLWSAHARLKTPDAKLGPDQFNLLMSKALEQCEAIDGVNDGFLNNPPACTFNPEVLQCNGDNAGACLSPAHVEAAKMIYTGAINPRTGVPFYPGLEPGSEGNQPGNPGWAMIMGDGPFFIDRAVLGGMGFEDFANWDFLSFDFDRHRDQVNAKLSGVLNAVDPDLRDFEANGSKLLIYHGWNDPGVMPQMTIDYYEEIIAYRDFARGSSNARLETQDFARLFMLPGMGHCRGGAGPDEVDYMSYLVDWVEQGNAPQSLLSSKIVDGRTTMTRPACLYPAVPTYTGAGDTNVAASFTCK